MAHNLEELDRLAAPLRRTSNPTGRGVSYEGTPAQAAEAVLLRGVCLPGDAGGPRRSLILPLANGGTATVQRYSPRVVRVYFPPPKACRAVHAKPQPQRNPCNDVAQPVPAAAPHVFGIDVAAELAALDGQMQALARRLAQLHHSVTDQPTAVHVNGLRPGNPCWDARVLTAKLMEHSREH